MTHNVTLSSEIKDKQFGAIECFNNMWVMKNHFGDKRNSMQYTVYGLFFLSTPSQGFTVSGTSFSKKDIATFWHLKKNKKHQISWDMAHSKLCLLYSTVYSNKQIQTYVS